MMDPITIAMGLAQFAPGIIKWMTGSDKAAEAAGKVVDIAKAVTGRPDGDSALAAIQADPNLALQYRLAIMANETEMDRAYLQDVADARKQTISLAEVGSPIAWGAPIVSVLIVSGYFFCIYLLFISKVDLPPNAFQLLNVMFGALSLAFGQVCNYWLGSSAGSKKSGDAIRDIAVKQAGR
jgi:hypothetical protein